MKVRACNNNWEWIFGRGKQDYANYSTGLAFDIKMQLQCWKRDCFFSLDDYLDWEYFLSTKDKKDLVKNSVYNQINFQNEVAGVQEITTEEYKDLRKIKVKYSYIDIYGNTVTNEVTNNG